MPFKDFLFLSSGDYFVQQSGTGRAILVNGLMRNICVTLS